jgi:ComF family protein
MRKGRQPVPYSGKEDVFSSCGDPARETASLGRKLVLSFAAVADGLFAVLFPSTCRFCAVPLTRITRVPVCDACLDRIQAVEGPVCAACGERVPVRGAFAGDGRELCARCSQAEPAFTRAAAYGSYDAGMRELIHLLKYEHVHPAANLLGRMLAEVIADLSDAFTGVPVVIPVPLHVSKYRQRGFNQSETIARAALKLHPAGLDLKSNVSALVRQKNTGSQTGLTPAQRRENMRGAFAVVRPDDVRGRDILLVDDVMTTGTTASECARVLRRAGAERVFVATVARVLMPEAARVTVNSDEEVRPQVLAAHV